MAVSLCGLIRQFIKGAYHSQPWFRERSPADWQPPVLGTWWGRRLNPRVPVWKVLLSLYRPVSCSGQFSGFSQLRPAVLISRKVILGSLHLEGRPGPVAALPTCLPHSTCVLNPPPLPRQYALAQSQRALGNTSPRPKHPFSNELENSVHAYVGGTLLVFCTDGISGDAPAGLGGKAARAHFTGEKVEARG